MYDIPSVRLLSGAWLPEMHPDAGKDCMHISPLLRCLLWADAPEVSEKPLYETIICSALTINKARHITNRGIPTVRFYVILYELCGVYRLHWIIESIWYSSKNQSNAKWESNENAE